MKKTLIIAAFAAAALAVSCQTKEIADVEFQDSNVFTCVLDQPDSKFSITPAGKTSWEPGDKIMIHGGENGADRLEVTLSASDISADGKKATFSIGDLQPYDRTKDGYLSGYYAQYPADLVPEGNMYYECAFQGTDAPLMAACNVGNVFSFKNLCGIIAFTVSGSFDKVVFAGNNKETVAFDIYQVRVRDDGNGPTVNYHKPGNNWPTYTEIKTVEKAVTADGSTINYIYLPKGVNFQGGFNFQFYDGVDLVKVAKAETAVFVDHGKILDLGNITSKLEDYVAPSFSDHTSSITGATDLSAANGPANCYVITKAGAYKFPAVRGNDAGDSAGSVFNVELVWETYNNAEDVAENSVIAKVDFDGPSNYLFFETPSTLKPGNALIAAKNDVGKIIWSWHIWIPATAIQTNTYGIYDHALMDRYLGALVAATTTSVPVESFGLHYEWGRKDPFLGAKDITGSGFATRSGTALSVGYQMTVAQTIANPATYAVYTEEDSWGNWLYPENDSNLWKDSEKTIYDPCPAGYRVPKRNTEQPLHSSDLSTVTGWSDNDAAGDNAAYFTLGNPVTVFPYGGLVCENGKYMDYTGGRSFIWTSSSNSDKNGRIVDVRLNGAHKINTTVTARGCSIRCVVDE